MTLMDSDSLAKQLLHAFPAPVFAVDEDVRILDYNAAAARFLGSPRPEVLLRRGGEVLHCIHAREAPGGCGRSESCPACVVRGSVKDAVAGGQCIRRRALMELQPGDALKQVHLLVTASAFVLNAQKLVLLVLEDIGELIGLQQSHSQLEANVGERTAELSFKTSLLEAQSETTLDGLLVVDARGKVILSNSRFQQLWSVPADLLASKDDEKLLAHALEQLKSPESFLDGVRRLYGHPEERSRDEIQFKDGRVLDRYSAPLVLRTGETAGRIWYFRDITESKRAEEALRQSEERFRTLVTATSQMVWHFNDAGENIGDMPSWQEFTGQSGGEMRGHGWSNAIHPDDKVAVQGQWARAVATKSAFVSEYRLRRRDGQYRDFAAKGVPILDTGGTIREWVGTCTDITERKQAETKMAEIQRELIETSRQAGMAEVATSILHNVGNVLNSVNIISSLVIEKVHGSKVPGLAKAAALLNAHREDLAGFLASDPKGQRLPGYLAALAARLEQEQAEILKDLSSLQDHVEHIKQVVAMQQDYARTVSVQETASIEQLVEDALQLNAAALDRHRVQVVRQYAQCPPVPIEKHKVLQILVNLIRNAKYALDEGRPAERRLVVRTEAADDRVRLSVQDNGIGIPAENLVRVFEFGFTTRKKGHGFGLHNGALAAKELGGTLTAHSAGPGQGALFVLELPLVPKQGTR